MELSSPEQGSKSDAPFSDHAQGGQNKPGGRNSKYQSQRLAAMQVALGKGRKVDCYCRGDK